MKKLAGIILALTLVFTLGTTSAFAAHGNRGGGHGRHNARAATCQFVDEDNDGICDVHSTDCSFIDENKDGICDNYPAGGARSQSKTGRQSGQGRLSGSRFVDSDGDGHCDNFGTGACGRR